MFIRKAIISFLSIRVECDSILLELYRTKKSRMKPVLNVENKLTVGLVVKNSKVSISRLSSDLSIKVFIGKMPQGKQVSSLPSEPAIRTE